MIKKIIFNFGIRWSPPPSSKKLLYPSKNFLPYSKKMLHSLKKLLDEKIFKASCPIKKDMWCDPANRTLSWKMKFHARGV